MLFPLRRMPPEQHLPEGAQPPRGIIALTRASCSNNAWVNTRAGTATSSCSLARASHSSRDGWG